MRKGSITLYLCLTLCVLLSLITVSYYSARITAGRVVLSSGLEQSLYSLFGEYDKDLFEKYGLLFIDGGRGNTSLQLHRLTGEVETGASYIFRPNQKTPWRKALLKMGDPAAEITAYSLATDGKGAAFSRQICTAAKEKLIDAGVELLKGSGEEEQAVVREQEAQKNYRSNDESAGDQELESAQNIYVDEATTDPRDAVANARAMGLFAVVLPQGAQVSDRSAELSDLPSGRTLQRGIGPAEKSSGIVDRALLQTYAAAMFSCYTDAGQDAGLQYQLEYLVCRKGSDAENLKGVLTRLMVMREASNLAFLHTNEQKRQEVLAVANLIGLGIKPVVLLVSAGIRAAWAFGEGVLDIRKLLAGGKVPLVKTAADWQLNYTNMSQFLSQSADTGTEKENGLTYKQYLNLMLAARGTDSLTFGMMDLIENSIRSTEGRENFRIDNCIDSIGIKLTVVTEGKELTASGRYGYGMDQH